jgi:hypothetical protein
MKHVTLEQLELVAMTRKEKLLRWANLIRENGKTCAQLFVLYDLEYRSPSELKRIKIHDCSMLDNDLSRGTNVFHIATEDPVFQSMGLAADATIPDIMKFLEIEKYDLHAVSCGCHGNMHRHGVVANRIEDLANTMV